MIIDIDYLVDKYNLSLNTNSNLGKKILNLINNNSCDDIVKIKFNSTKSYNKKNFEKILNTKIVELCENFNTSVNFTKLINLTEIIIGRYFNSDIILPDSVEKISFDENSIFNCKIEKYPKKLTFLKFGFHFNQSVENLPMLLKHLIFGYSFNQQINNLPQTLEYLYIGQQFNQNLDFLPNSIITLEFNLKGMTFSKSLDNLPISLKNLLLSSSYADKIYLDDYNFTPNYISNLNNLPDNIEYLRISNLKDIYKFPQKISKLVLFNSYNFSNITNIKNYDNITELEIEFVENNIFDIFSDIKNIKKMTVIICCPKTSKHCDKNILFIQKKLNELNNLYDVKIIDKYLSKDFIGNNFCRKHIFEKK